MKLIISNQKRKLKGLDAKEADSNVLGDMSKSVKAIFNGEKSPLNLLASLYNGDDKASNETEMSNMHLKA